MFGDTVAYQDKFKTCARTRPINCKIPEIKKSKSENNNPNPGPDPSPNPKPKPKPCFHCKSLKSLEERYVRPYRCQLLNGNFYSFMPRSQLNLYLSSINYLLSTTCIGFAH